MEIDSSHNLARAVASNIHTDSREKSLPGCSLHRATHAPPPFRTTLTETGTASNHPIPSNPQFHHIREKADESMVYCQQGGCLEATKRRDDSPVALDFSAVGSDICAVLAVARDRCLLLLCSHASHTLSLPLLIFVPALLEERFGFASTRRGGCGCVVLK